MADPTPNDAAASTAAPDEPSTLRRIVETLGWAAGQGPRLLRNNLSGFSPSWIRRFTGASSWAERVELLISPLVVDPRVLQRLVQSFPQGYFTNGSGTLTIIGSFDTYVRAATTLRARGERTAELFFRSSQGSAFTAEPAKYGACPYGMWEQRVKQEPHVTCQAVFPSQVDGVERLVDDFLADHVDKVVELGELLRPLVWDAMILTSYGVSPNDETRRVLAAFEEHTAEFDTSLRVRVGQFAPKWSDELQALAKEMGDWTWKTTVERKEEIEKEAENGATAAMSSSSSRTDVLSYALSNFPPDDLRAFDGALKALFTAGFNNNHCAIVGAMLANAVQDDAVYRYLATDSEFTDGNTRLEHVVRETLRLHTAIPVSRAVKAEDDFELDGKKLPTGASVVLPTVAVNTEPSAWEKPLEFDPSRFVGRKDVAYMCQKGFAPFGAAAELGGRQCAARFYIVHLQKVILGKMLRDYKMTKVGNAFFDFKQMIGSSQYTGHCKVRIERRAKA